MSPHELAAALSDHLLGQLPPDRAYARADLDAEALPRPVAVLLHRTLDRWLEREREGLRSDWFDFDAPSVRAAGNLYFEALSKTARVPAAAWAETLEGATWLVVRYLVTPARALTDAVFEGSPEPLPTETVRRRLGLFEAYEYLTEIADAYLEQKRPQTVDPDTLYGLLARIDRRMGAEADAAEWLRLLGPLFRLARRVPELDGVPAPVLARFFAAKGVDPVAERLEAQGEAVLDEGALRSVLADGETAEEREEPEPAAAPPPEEPEPSGPEAEAVDRAPAAEAAAAAPSAPRSEPEEEAPTGAEPEGEDAAEAEEIIPETVAVADEEPGLDEEVDPDEEPDGDEASVPLWRRFAADEEGPPEEAGAAPEEADEPDDESDPDPDDEPLWRRFASGGSRSAGASAGAATRPPASPEGAEAGTDLDALERRVLGRASAARRRRFVRNLFGGDEAAYGAVLRELDRVPTWTEAAEVIARDVFRKHRVDIYGEHAVAFTEAIEARYVREP
ncbi:MAG: hypothetical protein R3362_06350 [Rhodothermales bacterium]|nr:hypothetical protein [Rhodothermales bacterium]